MILKWKPTLADNRGNPRYQHSTIEHGEIGLFHMGAVYKENLMKDSQQ